MLPMLAVTLRRRLRCNLINRIDSGGVKSRSLSSKRHAMRYISIDLEARVKEHSKQLCVWEEQHNFADEEGKNGSIITKKERGDVSE